MYRKEKIWIFGILALVIFVALIISAQYAVAPVVQPAVQKTLEQQFPDYPKSMLSLSDGTSIPIVIADTDVRQEKGLSGVSSINENEGMLFAFDTPDKYQFWMKDMLIPIDIIWIYKNHIVHIKEHATPESYPDVFTPDADAFFVLEVADGFVKKHSIKIGDGDFAFN